MLSFNVYGYPGEISDMKPKYMFSRSCKGSIYFCATFHLLYSANHHLYLISLN